MKACAVFSLVRAPESMSSSIPASVTVRSCRQALGALASHRVVGNAVSVAGRRIGVLRVLYTVLA